MWVSHAEQPLRIDELCHALAVEMGATDIDLENIRPQDAVLGACLGLAMVDVETSTVRLIHYSLQEYLSRPGVLPDAHTTLSQTCLTYLNYDQVKRLPADNVSNLTDMPFLEYSSLHRGSHAIISVRKRPGRPTDSQQAFSPARSGQGETDLGFSGQALEKPAGFMGPGGAGRLSVYSL